MIDTYVAPTETAALALRRRERVERPHHRQRALAVAIQGGHVAPHDALDARLGGGAPGWSAAELLAEVLHPVGMSLRDQLVLRTTELVDRRRATCG